nr:MAG TPA: hypothetical protein [Caudoviricetes sp.]
MPIFSLCIYYTNFFRENQIFGEVYETYMRGRERGGL